MKKIVISNFRGFEHFEMDFTPGVTLLIGDNSAGKTSLLKALKYALSAFFSGFSDENTTWQSPSNEDFSQFINNDWTISATPIVIDFILQDDLIETGTLNGVPLRLRKNSQKNSRSLLTGIAPLRKVGQQIREQLTLKGRREGAERLPLPLFDSISTIYTHTDRKINKNKFLALKPTPSLGYLGALTGGGLTSHWWQRIKVLAETKERQWELEGVRIALDKALGPEGCNIIKGIRPIVSLNEIFIDYTDGTTVTYSMLPDGYQRLIDIVVNLAFRALLLNGELYHESAPQHTKGVVLIDEIDLHLHPTLQATVIQGLTNAFPNLQFIMTTHAPRVMNGLSNTPDNQVVRLRREPNGLTTTSNIETFGLDINSVFHLLGIPTRDAGIQKELEELFNLIDEGRNGEAQERINKLRERFGDTLPDLTEAETLISINDWEEAD